MNDWKDIPEVREIMDSNPGLAEEMKNFDLPQTFDINNVEIFAVGKWNGDKYTQDDLDSMVESFQKIGTRLKPFLKIGHSEKQALLARDEMPAAGWIKNVRRVGKKLLADFTRVPRKIYELIKAGAYSRVSSEIFVNLKVGKDQFPYALKAVSLLGGETPAVTTLKDVIELYAASSGEVRAYQEGAEVRAYSLSVDEIKQEEKEMSKEQDVEKVLAEKDAEIKHLSEENEALKAKFQKEDEEKKKLQKDEGGKMKDELEKLKKENAELKKKLSKFEKEHAEMLAEKKHSECEAKAAELVKARKLNPAQKKEFVALMENLPATEKKYTVGEGEGSLEEAILAVFSKGGAGLPDSEQSERGNEGGDLDAKVQKYIADQKAEGRTVSYREAFDAVGSQVGDK